MMTVLYWILIIVGCWVGIYALMALIMAVGLLIAFIKGLKD